VPGGRDAGAGAARLGHAATLRRRCIPPSSVIRE
jgi:hypothetical protein